MGTVALTVEEAAEALKVTRLTVYKLIKEDRIKAGRLSGYVYRIHPSEIDRFLLDDKSPPKVKKRRKVAARAVKAS